MPLRAGLIRTELDPVLHKPPLNLLREKLHPSVGLNTLHRKRQLFDYPVQKIKRVAGGTFFVDLRHPITRTVPCTGTNSGLFYTCPSVPARRGWGGSSVYIPPSSPVPRITGTLLFGSRNRRSPSLSYHRSPGTRQSCTFSTISGTALISFRFPPLKNPHTSCHPPVTAR